MDQFGQKGTKRNLRMNLMGSIGRVLEQRQNKNDSIQSKIIPILKLPRFFPHRLGGEKARQIQGWNYF